MAAPHQRNPRGRRPRRPGERGVLLVALLVGITVMLILLTASAQSWTAIMKREREEELIFRGNQYIQAIRQYHTERGQFPTELKALFEEQSPRGGRYIRTLYADPFSEDGEWNLIYLGPDGKTPFNPNAPNPTPGVPGMGGMPGTPGMPGSNQVRGVPGLPGSPSGLSGSSSRLSDRRREERDRRDSQASSRLRDRRRKSGFASGNLNSPIVGVVSKGMDRGFREYMGMQYYDEWEFHVFLLEMDPQGRSSGAIPGMNINPQGLQGVGHGAQMVNPNPAAVRDDFQKSGRGLDTRGTGRGNVPPPTQQRPTAGGGGHRN